MTYDEVKTILGREGFQSGKESTTEIYAFTNDMGFTLSTTFKEGKLVDKANFGLK
jgi:hypothetical protein